MTARECFNARLPEALTLQPVPAGALNTVIRFVATGADGGDWTIELQGLTPECRPYAPADDPTIQATMTMAASDFDAFFLSPSTALQMFLDKRLTVKGTNGKDAIKLRRALALIAP